MGDIVNLRLARKQKKRADKQVQASENRARHGLDGAEKRRQADEAARQKRDLDGKQREDGPPE